MRPRQSPPTNYSDNRTAATTRRALSKFAHFSHAYAGHLVIASTLPMWGQPPPAVRPHPPEVLIRLPLFPRGHHQGYCRDLGVIHDVLGNNEVQGTSVLDFTRSRNRPIARFAISESVGMRHRQEFGLVLGRVE